MAALCAAGKRGGRRVDRERWGGRGRGSPITTTMAMERKIGRPRERLSVDFRESRDILFVYTCMGKVVVMDTTRVFKSGNSQAVRIPRKFKVKEGRVAIREFGKGLLIEPLAEDNETWLRELSRYPVDLFEAREQPRAAEERDAF